MEQGAKKTYLVLINQIRAIDYFVRDDESYNSNLDIISISASEVNARKIYDESLKANKTNGSVVNEYILTYTTEDIDPNSRKREIADKLFESTTSIADLMDNTISNQKVEHNYKSIDGCVIVNFSYEPTAHYAERFDSLVVGNGRECDLFTGNEERAYRINSEVLVPKEELKLASPKEAQKLVEDAFNSPRWKWLNLNASQIEKEAVKIINLLPYLNTKEFIHPEPTLAPVDAQSPDLKTMLNILSTKEQVQLLEKHPDYLIYIKEPSVEVVSSVIKHSPQLYKSVQSQSPEMTKSLLEVNPQVFQYAKEQTDSLSLMAVEKDGLLLEYVDKQTERIRLAAVKENGVAIKFIKEPSVEVAKTAFEQNKSTQTFISLPMSKILQKSVAASKGIHSKEQPKSHTQHL